jgi:hypothetical protein
MKESILDKRLGKGNGNDDKAIFNIWNPFEPPLVLASNWLDGSQYRILERRPKRSLAWGIVFSLGLVTFGTKASEDTTFHVK